jgi:hypothetical protein
VGLVYDLMGLLGVMTVRSGVAGVLQMVLWLTLAVSRARTDQLRSIWQLMGQRCGYVCFRGPSSSQSNHKIQVIWKG